MECFWCVYVFCQIILYYFFFFPYIWPISVLFLIKETFGTALNVTTLKLETYLSVQKLRFLYIFKTGPSCAHWHHVYTTHILNQWNRKTCVAYTVNIQLKVKFKWAPTTQLTLIASCAAEAIFLFSAAWNTEPKESFSWGGGQEVISV